MNHKRYFVALIALLALASLPSALEEARHVRWQREADRMLAQLADNAADYLITHKRLPPSTGPTPPIGSCCWRDDGVCQADQALWQGPWLAWRFAIAGDHRYWYEVTTSADGQQAVLTATADLGCRGRFVRNARTLRRTPAGTLMIER